MLQMMLSCSTVFSDPVGLENVTVIFNMNFYI